jgi:hypothetical protein
MTLRGRAMQQSSDCHWSGGEGARNRIAQAHAPVRECPVQGQRQHQIELPGSSHITGPALLKSSLSE